MRLRTLAGRYAGQVRDYSTPVGLAALRTGAAEPIDKPAAVAVLEPVAPASRETHSSKRAAQRRERGQ